MKKSLLAVALIAGFAGAAHASSVTLYGTVDGGVGYTQFKDGAGNKADHTGAWNGGQSSNRWGLKGSEDLGSGLKAIFTLESGFNISDGTSGQSGRLFGREATVGLRSDDWGQIKLGRQGNIAYSWLAGVATPFGNNFGQARTAGTFSVAEVRYDNSIIYQTPSFSGFQAGLGYSFNADGSQAFKTTGNGEPNVRAITAGLRYVSGPLAAVLTYDQKKDSATATGGNGAGTSETVKSWNLAGSYDFDVVKLHLGFGVTEDGWFGVPSILRNSDLGVGNIAGNNDGFRAYSYSVGVGAPVGANGKVLAGWGMVDPDKNGVVYAGQSLKSQHTFSLAYTYDLSKRTNLYAMGTYVDNLGLRNDAKSYSIGAGVRHRF